ncbi:hypothetical protein HanPSC8_Chr01g0020041 [Helianthus annuus]|nr:hypothetical protein HanPSC8_Chr01g0020041 [Helianthus annuus]
MTRHKQHFTPLPQICLHLYAGIHTTVDGQNITITQPKQEPTSNGPEPAPEMVIPVNDNVMNLDQSEFSSFTSDELGWKTWNSDNVIISLTDMIVEDLVEEELVVMKD